MARDYRRLDVFHLADEVAIDMHRHTGSFPDSERYGLATQIRRAAVSAPANIVERRADDAKDFLRHIDIAAGSASEVRYLLSVSRRLGFGDEQAAEQFGARYDSLVRGLQALRTALRKQPE